MTTFITARPLSSYFPLSTVAQIFLFNGTVAAFSGLIYTNSIDTLTASVALPVILMMGYLTSTHLFKDKETPEGGLPADNFIEEETPPETDTKRPYPLSYWNIMLHPLSCSDSILGKVAAVIGSIALVILSIASLGIIPWIYKKRDEERAIKQELEIWKRDPKAFGNKELAAQRILEAFKNDSAVLDLEKLNLTILPSCIGSLTALHILRLSHNRLSTVSIPSTLTDLHTIELAHNQLSALSIPSTLTTLRHLEISNNQLTTVSIPSTLTALESLFLYRNRLTTLSLPSTLTALEYLILWENQLTFLPTEIGNCLSLSNLDIGYNPHLQTLPMSLGEISSLTTLDTYGTLITDAMRDSILASCQAKRSKQAVDRLPSQLELWRVSAKLKQASWPLMSTFDNSDKTAVYEWLTRLAKCSDFKCHQQDLAKIVCDILQDASKESFKESFLTQIRANNECCQDRAAMGLNELYVSWRLLCPQHNLSDKEQLKLLIGSSKTLALRAALGEILQKRSHVEQEGVEIYLYYEIALRKQLGLLTATQSMSYTGLGKRDWIDEKALIQTVQNSYADFVVDLPIFDSILEKDREVQQGIEAIRNKNFEELERLGDCPEKDPFSQEVLEWNEKLASSKNKYESQLKQFKKTWIQALAKKEGLA